MQRPTTCPAAVRSPRVRLAQARPLPATLAAKDHPTNPRRAAVTAAKQAPKAKPPAGRGADRERGHSGR
ncbi:hypothetical protein [Gordonia sp. YC-JH1]|uniref:hypothetical protein n=1 Tax=Gordonia sp. YC-JH1 TaxID=2059875 RepID=UPI0013053965|nr:hypothetical protein [Gordonia sp. YC-JH1]